MKPPPLRRALALLALAASPAPAQWVPVEHFDALTPGDIRNQNGWGRDDVIVANVAADPADAANQTLAYTSTGGDGNVYRTCFSIADGSTGTVFLRFQVAGTAEPDAPFGLASGNTPDFGSTNYAGKFRGDAANVWIQNAGGANLAANLAYGAWYKLWMVTSNPAGALAPDGTVQFFLQRDGDPSYPTPTLIGSDNSRIATTEAIDTIGFHKYNANGPIYIDDIFFSAGAQNLTDPTVDTDGDGLPDAWELAWFPDLTTTDGTTNSDSDGLTDAQEYLAGANPTLADTDGDGLDDDEEAAHNSNPANPDTDGDGLQDGAEVNTHSTLPDTHDSDGDGVGDGLEVTAGTSPTDGASTPPSLAGSGSWSVTYKEATATTINTLALADGLFSGEIPEWGGVYPPVTLTGTYPHLNFSVSTTAATPDGYTNPDANTFRFAGNLPMPVPDPLEGQGFILENCAIKATGILLAQQAGTYTFNSVTDDGSRLTIDGEVVDNNDKPQGAVDRFVQVPLERGFHTVEHFTFQGGGAFSQELSVYVVAAPRTDLGDIRDWKLVPAADLDTDADTNGLPDEWESFYAVTSGPAGDDDADTLTNADELAQLSDPTVADTDGDGVTDADEFAVGANPRVLDSDGDGIPDGTEQALGTSLVLTDTDGDGFSDGQEVAAGSSPTNAAEGPDTYVQTFDSFADGTTTFTDGASLTSNLNQASVQNKMLRLLQDGLGSSTALFRIPPLAGSDTGWCVSFDCVMDSANEPADGFSLAYGPIATSLPGGAEEEGFRVDDTVSFSTITYPGAGNQGHRIRQQVAGSFGVIPGAEIPGLILAPGQPIRGRFTATFDGAGNLVGFSTAGMLTNAFFNDIATAITAAQTHSWTIAARTGGADQGLSIVAIAATAGNTDRDADGLLDAWELTQGLDPASTADGATVDSDGDGMINADEFDYGTNPLAADSDGDGANDPDEQTAGSNPWLQDTDGDGLNDGDELAFGSSPLLADADGDGLTDPLEQANQTDPWDADTDTDGYSDSQEVGAGSNPTLASSLPTRYFQTFDSFPDGTRAFVDGSTLEGGAHASVQDKALRVLQNGVGGATTIYRIPPLPHSDEGWCISFDFAMGSTGTPADGLSVNYGPIAGLPVGGDYEYGFLADDTLSLASVTYNGSANRGVRIYQQVAGIRTLLTNPATANQFGSILADNSRVSGRFTAVFDGSGNTVSWTTTGTLNNAAFEDFITTISTADSHTWALAGRTGGAHQDLFIKHIAITAGAAHIDADNDGLLDAWELTQGLDPASNTDGATIDSDGDGLANGTEFLVGSHPLDTDSDDDGLTDAQEDSDRDGLADGAEVNATPPTNPLAADTDGDGLTDQAEVATHHTNPATPDSDADSFPDGVEVALGSDPNSPAGTPTLPDLATGLVGYWPLDGNLTEISGFRAAGVHDGAPIGTIRYSASASPGLGQALDVTGATGGVRVRNTSYDDGDGAYQNTFDAYLASTANAMTIACWACGFPGDWSPWVAKRGEDNLGYQLRRRDTQNWALFTIRGTPGDDDPTGAIDISSNRPPHWIHLVATWDGATGVRKLYVNGVEDVAQRVTGDYGPFTSSTSDSLTFGCRDQTGYGYWLDGKVDDVAIWATALDAAQVATLHWGGSSAAKSLQSILNPQQSPYDAWISGYYPGETSPAVIGPSADPDHDALDNLLEFAFGTNPAAPDGGPLSWDGTTLVHGNLVVYDADPGPGADIRARFLRRTDGSVDCQLQFSSDLTDWEVLTPPQSVLATDGVYQLIEVAFPATMTNGRTPRFLRLKLTLLEGPVQTPYDIWIGGYYPGETNPAVIGPTANPDSDSPDNLLEFAFGTDPTAPDGTALRWDGTTLVRGAPMVLDANPGPATDIRARYLKRTDGSTACDLQFSSDLTDWETLAPPATVLTTDGAYQLLEVPFPATLTNGKTPRFLRVAVTLQ